MQETEWREEDPQVRGIISNHAPGKGLHPKCIRNSNNSRNQRIWLKNEERITSKFLKRDMSDLQSNFFFKLNTSTYQGNATKTTMRYQHTAIRMHVVKKTNGNTGKHMKKRNLCALLVRMWVNTKPLWRTVWIKTKPSRLQEHVYYLSQIQKSRCHVFFFHLWHRGRWNDLKVEQGLLEKGARERGKGGKYKLNYIIGIYENAGWKPSLSTINLYWLEDRIITKSSNST